MKMEDILTLCKAGFTAEQIVALTGEQKQPEQKQPEQIQQEQKQQEQKPNENAALLNAISALTAKIETLNIQNSHMQENAQSVDDILASVILPNGGAK